MSSVMLLLLATLPALVYAFLIYGNTPYKRINLKYAVLFLLSGMMIIVLLQMLFQKMGMSLYNAVEFKIFSLFDWFGDLTLSGYFNMSFIRAAAFEEIIKLITFLLLGYMIKVVGKNFHPIANMFYFALLGLGFAILENQHMFEWAPDGTWINLYFTRSSLTMIMHMLSGLFAGYWISLGELKTSFKDTTFFGWIWKRYPILKKCIFIIAGLFAATSFHGLFNFSSLIFGTYAFPIMMLLLMMGLTGAYFGGVHLNTIYKNSLEG